MTYIRVHETSYASCTTIRDTEASIELGEEERTSEKRRQQWNSNLGFIFAAIGSAVGIGNIWRFPYVVGTSGGGAFLFIYMIIVVTVLSQILGF